MKTVIDIINHGQQSRSPIPNFVMWPLQPTMFG